MSDIVLAARNFEQPLTRAGADDAPTFCHEAVVGWLLISLGYPHAWQLLRQVDARAMQVHFAGGRNPAPQTFGTDWLTHCLYPGSIMLMQREALSQVNVGDVVWVARGGDAVHSMVVVEKGADTVLVRGFNNSGTFAFLAKDPPRGVSEYDANDRDIADPLAWQLGGGAFGTQPDGRLKYIRLQKVQQRIAEFFPWEGAAQFATLQGPRWHHNFFQHWHYA